MIDVVIPVYNAAADFARCVESVLAHTTRPHRLILIDDGSPDPAIAAHFESLARRRLPQVVLLRNERNLGFTRTANRGMGMSNADIVLLNSDTVVTGGWLDALARCAASDRTIGTITPFSNNAEICSFPRFCEDNRWLPGDDPEQVRSALAHAAVPTYPELPTGVGFCLYLTRALIDAIGTFDPVFGLGYGEENDLCLRAARAGFRNVLCDDAFVLHLGGRSFEGRKATLGPRNLELVVERHPRYLELVRDYIAADPLRPIRDAALTQLRVRNGPPRGVLHVIDDRVGDVDPGVRALIDASRTKFRHYVAVAVEDSWTIEEQLDDGSVRRFDLRRAEEEAWVDFVGGICATFGIGVLHLHDNSGCRAGIGEALAALGPSHRRTIEYHDVGCPTMLFLDADGNYCEAKTDHAAGGICLARKRRAAPSFLDPLGGRPTQDGGLGALSTQPAAAAIVQQTLERYEAAPAATVTRIAPFSRARIRDALGYKGWTSPIVEPPVSESATTFEPAPRTDTDAGVAAMALRLRMVRLDRVLHWLNPARIRDAVKARLR